MNTQQDYQYFLQKKAKGLPMSVRDIAVRIDNEPEHILGFICDNDAAQVHALLHHSDAPGRIGQGMSFTPDGKKCFGELKLLLAKRYFNTINDVLKNFRINMNAKNYTGSRELLRELELIQEIREFPASVLGRSGYGFTKKF